MIWCYTCFFCFFLNYLSYWDDEGMIMWIKGSEQWSHELNSAFSSMWTFVIQAGSINCWTFWHFKTNRRSQKLSLVQICTKTNKHIWSPSTWMTRFWKRNHYYYFFLYINFFFWFLLNNRWLKQGLSPDRIARMILHILFLEFSKSVNLILTLPRREGCGEGRIALCKILDKYVSSNQRWIKLSGKVRK